MSTSIGTKAIMGCRKELTFRTRVNVASTGDRVPLLSEGIEFDYSDILHEHLFGVAGIPASERVFEPVGGSLECEVPYTVKNGTEFVSADTLLALAMGTVTWDAGSGANRVTFLDDLNVFGTIAWDKGHDSSKVWQAISCYVNSLTLSCNAEETMKMSCDVMAYDLAISDTTNSVSTLSGLPTDVADLVKFSDFVFRIGDQAGKLVAGDQIAINGFTLTINNNLTDPGQSTPLNTGHTDSLQPIQPVRGGFREVLLEFTLPRYDADTFLDFISNNTNLQADLMATHPSSSEEFDIIFPNLKVESVSAPIAGPDVVTQTVSLRCFRRNSASDMEFSTYGGSDNDPGEVWFELDNDRGAVISDF